MLTRKEKALITRKKLIISASKLISQKGIDNVNVEEITNDAGVAKGSFYTYFNTKEDIIKELVLTINENYDEFFLKKSLKEKIEIFNENLQRRITSCGIEVCRCWISNNLKKEENSVILDDLNIIKLILNSSVDNCEIDKSINISEYANNIININYGAMINWCMTDGVYNPLDHIKDITNVILDSLKK